METEHNWNILTPHSYGRHVVSFLFSWCSTGGLGAHFARWSATSYQQLLRPPNSIVASLPHLDSNCVRSSTQLCSFCSIRRPYITFKLPRGDIDTPPRLRNFFRYLAIGMCHFRYLWNDLCDRHRAEITVMQFRGHSLPVRQSMRV